MKFLCPSCKAKYQIADEKVAGRSVRMKCRKCGHLIQISKAVTEGSVSRRLSEIAEPEQSASPAPPSPSAPAKVRPPPRPSHATPSAPRAAPPPRRSSPLAVPRPRSAPRPSAAKVAAAAAATSPDAASRESKERASPAADSAAEHAQPSAKGNGAAQRATSGAAFDSWDDDERTIIAGSGALAGVFSELVRQEHPSALDALNASSDEWYVGINGVPVGPIRLSELRSKAAAGAVTPDSLVWRDGFEQWMPLSTFPELVAVIEEGLSSARASFTPMVPAAAPKAAPVSGVGEIRDPFAQAPNAQDAATVSPPSPAAPVTGPAVVTEQPTEAELLGLVPPRRGSSLAPWIAVVVAFLFGGTIAFVLFSRDHTIVKYVTREVPTKAPAANTTKQAAAAPSATPPDQSATASPTSHGTRVAAKSASTQKGKTSGKPLTGLQGLADLAGAAPTGPNVGSSSGHSGGQPLDSSRIERTVSRYTGSVKRSCWQPAIDTRDKDAPSSARVMVTIHVAPSGGVQSASAGGDPRGYHGLASCIAARVRGWQFPSSSGSTTVKIPFVFATQ